MFHGKQARDTTHALLIAATAQLNCRESCRQTVKLNNSKRSIHYIYNIYYIYTCVA